MPKRCAAGRSRHPDAAEAVAEAIADVLERASSEPSLAVLFVSAHHRDSLANIVGAVRALLRPAHLLGAAAAGVLGGTEEIEDGPGLVIWAAECGPVDLVLLDAVETRDGTAVLGWDDDLVGSATTALLVADPFSFPVEGFLAGLRRSHPGLSVIGGLASAGNEPGGNRLVADGHIVSSGAVAVLIHGDEDGPQVRPLVSQGCRPVGEPFVVTRATRNVVHELGSRLALERLGAVAAELDEPDRGLLQRGVHLGVVVDESLSEYRRGDFWIRPVVGGRRAEGSIVVGAELAVGTTVQFHVRDAQSAADDLSILLGRAAADGPFEGALVFSCNGRGSRLFASPGHDAGAVAALAGDALAGMFCAGEVGPIGGRNAVHSFTASVALFATRASR